MNRKAASALIVTMLITLVVKCMATALGGNYLYADGAGYLYNILQNGAGVSAIEGRQGSFALMESFIVIGLKLGITDVKLLCALFGIGSVIWLGAFALLAMLLCRKHDQLQCMAIMAVVYAVVNIFVGFFTQIESTTAVGIYFYLLIYYMISKRNEDWPFRVIACGLLIILPNANEYFIGFAPVLLMALLVRVIRERRQIYIIEWIVHAGICIYTIYRSYLAVTQGAPTDSLKRSIQTLPERKYYWILLCGILIVLVLAVIDSKIHSKMVRAMMWVLSALCCGWLGFTVYYIPRGVAITSFSMRFMNLLLPVAVGVICILLWIFRIDMKKSMIGMAIVFLLINCAYDVQVSARYHDYLVQINRANQERRGFFEIFSTDIDRTYCWGWPLPMESLLAQCIQGETVIDSNMIYQFDMQRWEAFDSDNIEVYGDLSRYGIQIDRSAFVQ